jgi:hypothetical protein
MIPTSMFVFKFSVPSQTYPGSSVQCERKVRACGIDDAKQKFEQEFLEWGEEVPKDAALYEIWGIQ